MKKLLFYICLISISFGCKKDFGDYNIDPTKANEGNMEPQYLFTSGQINYSNITEFQIYTLAPMVQILASTASQTAYSAGDKYTSQLFSYNDRFFEDGQITAGLFAETQLLAEKKGGDKYWNLVQASRVMRVMALQRVTDLYGDIPYFQANGTIYPKYDTQESIYKDMLATLEDAAGKFDGGKGKIQGDLFYDGDVEKWKRFTYSLMLRVAMRLIKVDATIAQMYAEKTKGKTFTAFTDNAIVKFVGNTDVSRFKTTNSLFVDGNTFGQVRWSETFINFLKNTNDPRLYTITEKSDAGMSFNEDVSKSGFRYTAGTPNATTLKEVPVGMPNGYDIGGVRNITTAPNYPGPTGIGSDLSPLGNYARPIASVFARPEFSAFNITYAQTELLLAEARLHNWNVSDLSAAEHYKNGVVAAMKSLEQLNGILTMGTEVDDYINNHPLDTDQTKALEMINNQYWIASIYDFPETWSNYRRSGFPKLNPVNYPGNVTNGTIPRRLNYPNREASFNANNYLEAVSRLGGNDQDLTKRTWWDK